MIGRLIPQKNTLSCSQYYQYRLSYCSLCAGLRNEKGLIAGLALSHEMSILLTFALKADTTLASDRTPCPSTLGLKNIPIKKGEVISKVANLNLLLATLKGIDYFAESHPWLRKRAHVSLRKRLDKQLDGFSEELVRVFNAYVPFASLTSFNFYECIEASGNLCRSFAKEILPNEEKLHDLFEAIGVLLPLSDAIEDEIIDSKRGVFNPILVSDDVEIQDKNRAELKNLLYQTALNIRKIAYDSMQKGVWVDEMRIVLSGVKYLYERTLEQAPKFYIGVSRTKHSYSYKGCIDFVPVFLECFSWVCCQCISNGDMCFDCGDGICDCFKDCPIGDTPAAEGTPQGDDVYSGYTPPTSEADTLTLQPPTQPEGRP